MNAKVAVLIALVAAGCTPKGSFQGKLVHAITGQPVAGKALALKSDPPAPDVTCQSFPVKTDDAGLFKVEATCGDTLYKVVANDKDVLLEGPPPIDGGVITTAPVEIKMWPTPDTGVFILNGDSLSKQAASWKVESKNVLDSEELVFFPTELPNETVKVGPGQYLVLSGDRTIEAMQILPLLDSGPRTFGTSKEKDKDEAWSYIGVKFNSDTEFERVTAEPKADRILEKKEGDVQVRFIEGTALPPGKYTLMPKAGKRAYIVEFIGG